MDSICCYICGIRESDGAIMSKSSEHLLSVTQTIQNSTTLVSDILSRILNETVRKEEKICHVCCGHLNNIDFHLKEAQEITDDITNKFLDKSRGASRYTSSQITSVKLAESVPIQPHPQQSSSNKENIQYSKYTNRSPKKVIWSEFEAEKAKSKETSNETEMVVSQSRTAQDEDSLLTEDEMSVNIIDKNKAKLISHVLNPGKKQKKIMKGSANQTCDKASDEVEVDNVKKASKRSKKDTEISLKPPSDLATPSDEVGVEGRNSKHMRMKKTDESSLVNSKELNNSSKVFYAKKTLPETTAQSGEQGSKETEAPTCSICHRTFKRKLNLQLHYEKIHNIHEQPVVSELPETHRCSYCTREFTNFKSLKAHENHAHANKEDSDYDDDDEDEDNDESENENDKKRIPKVGSSAKGDGKNQPKASCPICHKTFQRAFNAKTHMLRVHEKIKNFVCHVCDKGFTTNSDLNQHMVVHGEGKSFKCEICDREFFNRDSIILHRKQHLQQLTHFCKICKKGFYKASCLNRHLRSHTGERPFTCTFCQKSFSQSTSLKLHSKKCKKNQSSEQQSTTEKNVKSKKGKRVKSNS